MKAKLLSLAVIAAALLGLPEGVRADAGSASEAAKEAKQAPTTVQKLISNFTAQRQALIDERQKVLEKLKAAATPAERQKILSEAKKSDEALVGAKRDLAKQLRDEIKALREDRRGLPGG